MKSKRDARVSRYWEGCVRRKPLHTTCGHYEGDIISRKLLLNTSQHWDTLYHTINHRFLEKKKKHTYTSVVGGQTGGRGIAREVASDSLETMHIVCFWG